jgi:hypothetical protein
VKEHWKIAGCTVLIGLLGPYIGLQIAERFAPIENPQQAIKPEGDDHSPDSPRDGYTPLVVGVLTLVVLGYQTVIFNRQARIAVVKFR